MVGLSIHARRMGMVRGREIDPRYTPTSGMLPRYRWGWCRYRIFCRPHEGGEHPAISTCPKGVSWE